MAKITTKQISSINNKCYNGWKLDVQYYMYHNEKTLIKDIELDEEHYLQFAIRYNWKNQISLHISKFFHKKDEAFASTSGMGKRKILNSISAQRKDVKKLIEFTKTLTDDKLMEINENTPLAKGNGLILESEEF